MAGAGRPATNCMSALVFVDTNVFVYRHDNGGPAKQARADEWIAHLARSRTGRLSYQVLQELYVTLTAKARIGVSPVGSARNRSGSCRLATRGDRPQDPGTRLAYPGRPFRVLVGWPSLSAAAQSLGCSILLTEELQHGHAFGELRVVDPFSEDSGPRGVNMGLTSPPRPHPRQAPTCWPQAPPTASPAEARPPPRSSWRRACSQTGSRLPHPGCRSSAMRPPARRSRSGPRWTPRHGRPTRSGSPATRAPSQPGSYPKRGRS